MILSNYSNFDTEPN